MQSPSADKESSNEVHKTGRLLICVALIALIHCSIWFSQYGQTALGESPALDNRQTLELAQAMASGMQDDEPFHRTPLYPYLLSLLLSAGLPFDILHLVARWFNALALAATAATVSLIAFRIWGRLICGWFAGLLIALNPVIVFFAADAFPILFATIATALAIHRLLFWLEEPSIPGSALIAFWLTVGAAFRSHLMFLVLVWPVAALIFSKRRRITNMAVAILPFVLSLLMIGYANLRNSGEFQVMPWQGSFILWATNGPHADGRIYTQQVRVKFDGKYDNPSKLESIVLYEQETGKSPPHNISEMNAHWKGKTIEHVIHHPINWLSLMCRKAYYFINNYEQYDNKTYSFHRARHPYLRLNPIHWGGIFTLATIGAIVGLHQRKTRLITAMLITAFIIYAGGTIIFVATNRYRVPIIPILCILASGAVLLPNVWSTCHKIGKTAIIALPLLAGILTYSTFFEVNKKNTWEEDFALLANAAMRTDRDEEAVLNSTKALEMNANRADMYAVLAQALFNQWALEKKMLPITTEKAAHLLSITKLGSDYDPNLIAVTGVYEWKLGRPNEAIKLWEQQSPADALAKLCLIWTGNSNLPDAQTMKHYEKHPAYELLRAAIEARHEQKKNPALSSFMSTLLQSAHSPADKN